MSGTERSLFLGLLALVVTLVAGPAPAYAESELEGMLKRRIIQFVRSYAPIEPTSIQVPELSDFASFVTVEGLSLRLSANPNEDFLGSVPVTVVLLVEDLEVKRGVVTVRVRTDRPVLVAARRLRRGDEVQPGDVRSESMEASRIPSGVVTEMDELVGMRAARGISAGTPWQDHLVEPVPAVTRGQIVRVLLESGPLRIQALAKAREDAFAGQLVRVTNLDSKRDLVGRARADGSVDVGP